MKRPPLTKRNAPIYAATTAKTPNNRNEPTNEAVGHDTISDFFDSDRLNTEVGAQGVHALQEGSDHSEELIPCVGPCGDE